jgi:cystathionine gamma-synthase
MTRPGSLIALAERSYYGHAQLFRHLAPWGVRFVEFDQTGPPPSDAELVILEAPSNPSLEMPSFEAATDHPARVICDATVASPVFCRPLELGCDVVLHSATKVLGGHDDLLAGVLTVCDPALRDELHLTRRLTGMVASPDTAWLLHRGLATLEVRIRRMDESARTLAERLRAHESVLTVRYPGFSHLLSFDVVDGDAAGRVERTVRVIENATSLGGTRSKLEARGRWEGSRIPSGLLRLSVGLEDVEALWTDLEQALEQA